MTTLIHRLPPTVLRVLCVIVATLLLSACDDGSDTVITEPSLSPAEQLLDQLGDAARFFDVAGLDALLSLEDDGQPVTLVTLYAVNDDALFQDYYSAVRQLWANMGAEPRISSKPFGQLLGERTITDIQAVRFPSITMLREAMSSGELSDAMIILAQAIDDTAWVLGTETTLPPPSDASFFNPDLQNLTQNDALALLAAASGPDTGELESNAQVAVDMLVSDDPSPFFMVNLIKYYEQANYPDGRETDLTGEEANAIYGNAILPQLLAYNSVPVVVIPQVTVLTREPAPWEQVAIVRYASRDAFLTIFPLNPQISDSLIHKEAGVETTQVWATSVDSETLPTPVAGPFYNFRYCEVLLGNFLDGLFQADVYNSIGYSDCPQEDWDALDGPAIAAEFEADVALLNGIRFWVLDGIVSTAPLPTPELETFGGITMRLGASVTVAPPEPGGESAYEVAEVVRSTVFTYAAGRQVYELHSPDGDRYMMQSFSRVNDPDQALVDLQFLGRRLELPQGWQFSTRVLQEEFQLRTVEGIARVVSDDLNNVYQRVPD